MDPRTQNPFETLSPPHRPQATSTGTYRTATLICRSGSAVVNAIQTSNTESQRASQQASKQPSMAGCQNSVVRALCSATIAATSFAVAVEAWEPQRQQRSPRRWRVTQPKSFFYCGWNNKGEPSAVGASLAPPFPLFDPFSSTTTTTNLAAATSEVISPDRSLAIDDIIETDKSNKDLVMESLRHLTRGGSGSDIRGHFVNHSWGPEEADGDDGVWKQGAKSSRRSVQLQPLLNEVARAIQNDDDDDGNQDTATPPRTRRKTAVLTPLAAYCIGRALAISITNATTTGSLLMKQNRPLVVGIGVDPRPHGRRLADALADGIRSGNGNRNTQQPAVHVAMTVGIATTPACASFCRYDLCDAAVVRMCRRNFIRSYETENRTVGCHCRRV